MMSDCEQIRPLLFPYLEREVEPAEAIRVANHLSACTACKILMARKRRLGQMLEDGLEDSIPVGEDFVRSVMATLPDGPPPGPQQERKRRRRFDLALVIGAAVGVGVTQALAAGWPPLSIEPGGWAWPALDLPVVGDPGAGLSSLFRSAAIASDGLASLAAIHSASFSTLGATVVAGAFGVVAFALLGGSTVLAVAWRRQGNP
ncbi:MAG TPA: zf-HC2 domain-containing protein [Candidatus Polarisedimenticolaceae bacterium]|nr:zf-HC2 domain-containing protein [Candidatus Polarisedimenticolaceae bacterium]